MRCPFCSHDDTQVVETRDSDEGDVVRRRRRCPSCDKRFTTYERAEIALPSVVKKDGTPRRVRSGQGARLDDAGAAQAPGQRRADRRRDRAHPGQAAQQRRRAKCCRPSVGELVMRELKRIDKVAYVRFASVYRSFEDVDEFSQLIRDI